MIVVADASVLVAELMRRRGWALIRDPRLRISVAEEQWSETQHELDRRLRLIIERDWVTDDAISLIRQGIQGIIDDIVIEVVPRHVSQHLERIARRRIPRDPDDWPTVALALALGAGILTSDNDFLGCGCPTWTVETLSGELEEGEILRP
jgi:predicted nucleic acid-binding protein